MRARTASLLIVLAACGRLAYGPVNGERPDAASGQPGMQTDASFTGPPEGGSSNPDGTVRSMNDGAMSDRAIGFDAESGSDAAADATPADARPGVDEASVEDAGPSADSATVDDASSSDASVDPDAGAAADAGAGVCSNEDDLACEAIEMRSGMEITAVSGGMNNCGGSITCHFDCPGGNCTAQCNASTYCDLQCADESCQINCNTTGGCCLRCGTTSACRQCSGTSCVLTCS